MKLMTVKQTDLLFLPHQTRLTTSAVRPRSDPLLIANTPGESEGESEGGGARG